jgi:rod shape-determining protein MreC
MKIFKNKFFIITLSIALFITILTSTLSLMGQTDPIKNALNTLTLPLRYAGNKISEGIEGFKRYFDSLEELHKENESLREEINSLRGELADKNATKEENERLRDYLAMKEKYRDFKLNEALIIGREGEDHATFFTLNKGKNDGIEVGMAVMVKEGLVGSICDAGPDWSRVRVINEASASAGAYVQRSGEIGVLCGDIAYKDTGLCTLKYLKENADVEEGDLIFTSGEGSVYPSGIYVGKVTSVNSDGFSRSKTATVECAVDFEALDYVIVITDSTAGD